MREFTTAAREHQEVDEESLITFMHDGQEVTFYEPDAGQLAIMSTLTSTNKTHEVASTIISFFFSVMDEDTSIYFRSRLLDRNDPFELDDEGGVMDIFEYLMEEWSGKASTQPQDYRPKQSTPGRSSTGTTRAKASTSSRSRSTASSTSSKRGPSKE